jgi:Tol biopolymer transport system component
LCCSDSGEPVAPAYHNRVLFVDDLDRIYSITPEGTDAQFVAVGIGARWSRDAKKVAFFAPFRPGFTQITTMNLDGTDRVSIGLFGGVFGSYLSWTPDSRFVMSPMFQDTVNQTVSLYLLAADGSAKIRLQAGLFEFDLSPDGKKIAFTTAYDSAYVQMRLYVASFPGFGGLKQLGGGYAGNPAWSPDGEQIAFWNGADICITDTTGGQFTNITNGASGYSYYSPRWSPDGARLICLRSESFEIAILCIMNRDGSNLHRMINWAIVYGCDWSW